MHELNALEGYRSVAVMLSELFTGEDDDSRAWIRHAACAGTDPDLWFPGRGESTADAKRVCRGCPVRVECLEYALERGEKFGVWGGVSERERRRIRRQRMLERTPPNSKSAA